MIFVFFIFMIIEMHNGLSWSECRYLNGTGYLYFDDTFYPMCQQTSYNTTAYPYSTILDVRNSNNETVQLNIYSTKVVGTPHYPYSKGYYCDWYYGVPSQCLRCHQARGNQTYLYMSDIIYAIPKDCSRCNPGYQPDNVDYCIQCPGANRGRGCQCLEGYMEQNPIQQDCVVNPCLSPCKVCQNGSNTQCASCQDSLMIRNLNNYTCECPKNYYMTSNKNQCLQCDYTCGTCFQSSWNCVTCPPSSNRYYSQGSCLCRKYYFQINGYQECFPCQWSCETCDWFDGCTSCPPNSNREMNSTRHYDSFCNCIEGFAENIITGQCEICSQTCQTCIMTTDTCLECISLQYREFVDYSCLCMNGYYEATDSPICKSCEQTCLTCNGKDPDNCLSCSEEKIRILNDNNECHCQLGYGYKEDSTQCLKCVGICLQCDHYEKCTQCPEGLNRIIVKDKCACDSGFYEDSGQLCQSCHYSCQTCFGFESDKCHSCSDDSARSLVVAEEKQYCKCKSRYFELDEKCMACYQTCQECTSQSYNSCTKCPSSRTLEQSQCKCSSKSQFDDGQSLECQDCHYSCLTCNGPGINNCITYKSNSSNDALTINRFLEFGQCICPKKWFDNLISEKCLKCHDSCETCFDLTEYSCITCSEIDHRIQRSNSCYCQDGYFEKTEINKICQQCEYRCGTCEIDSTNCLTCYPGSLRSLVKQANQSQYNTCQCPATAPNDVIGNPFCLTCHFTCKNCSDLQSNQCTVCDALANRVLKTDDNGSYCQCNLSYYEIQTPECAACSTYCLGCVDSANNCTSCNPAQFRVLDGNKCICGLRFGTKKLSYYDNLQDPECIACHYSCYTCNGEQYDKCLTCSDSDFRIQQDSKCICKPKYIDNGEGECMTCNQSCETCQGQKSLCTSCPPNSLRSLNVNSKSCDCPQGYFDSGEQLCEQCDITCATCNNQAIFCLSCLIGSNRILNKLNNYCECISGYFNSGNGICSQCHYSCLQCSGPSASECTSCPDYLYSKRIITNSQCVCADQYFDDSQNKLCQPCSSTCYTCSGNQNSCTQCVNGQNRVLVGQTCSCFSSYYDNSSPICEKCNSLCQECQINSNFCIKCDSSLFRTLNSGNCTCDPGYFDDGSLMCKKCHFTCLTCNSNQTNCTSCDSKNLRKLTSTSCLCQAGTIDQGSALCFHCDFRCLTCQNVSTKCLTCDSKQFRILNGEQCKCKDGYFENAITQCQVCDRNCLTCDQLSTTCSSCNKLQNKIINQWQCICDYGYYPDSNDDCQACSKQCKTCATAPNRCTSCNTDRDLVIDKCNCLASFFEDADSKCQPCNYSCLTCSNANQCLQCDSTSNRTLQSQKCNCNQGFYDIGTHKCFPCKSTCLTCITSDNKCTSCDSSLNRVLKGTTCECKLGYFEDGNQLCQQCHYSCPSCTQSASKCTSCDVSNTFRLDQSTQFNQCPCRNGFYEDGTKICKKCSYQCLNCQGSKDNCTFCYTNPGYLRDNITPTCNCQNGYFDDGIQIVCQQCSPKCLTCQGQAENCLVCESQLKRQSSPQCDCKEGYFEDKQKKCQQCSMNCLSCSGNSKNCTTCQADRITKQCLCQDGYYEAYQVECQLCSHKCSTCFEHPLNCTNCALNRINPPNCICQDHYYDDFINPECQECDQFCGRCDFTGCIDCAANRIQNLKTCICPNDSISYTFTPYCSNCDVAVVQGIFSDDLSELIYTFEYDLQFNFITKVDTQQYCQELILEQSLLLIGESPQCRIEQNKLIVSLGTGSIITVGDILQFNNETLKHTQCQTPLKTIINQKLQPPSQLLNPEIIVNYPSVPVSPCSSVEIFISQQKVSGQRNLKLKWSSSLSIPAIEIANQYQFLNLAIESPPENSNIDIQINYTNFLGQNGSTNISFQTLSASIPQLQFKTIKKSFILWAPIKVSVYFTNTICTQGSYKSLTNPVQIQFEEIVTLRNPQIANPIQFQQSLFNLEESEGLISSIISARTLSVNTNYSIQSKFQDLKSLQQVTTQYDFSIEKSPLMVQIVGGTKIQNYLKAFQVLVESKDPDLQTEWNKDPYIALNVQCIDLSQENNQCVDQFGQVVKMNKTSYSQQIAARIFKPFTVLIFKVECQKYDQKAQTQASIILLDAELPSINISYPQGYKIRDVNINEKLKFQILVDRNQKFGDYDFSYALVYNYETVFVKNVPNQMVEFALWEGFQKFGFINQISVRLQAHDIKYLMPQIASVTLTVNMPPVNSIPSIQPQRGNALFTSFTMRITNSKDKDLPLQYRYSYYESWELYQKDLLSGRQENLIILQDFTPTQTFQTILESGNLTILLTVSDSLGSQVNFTQQVYSQSFYEQWQLETDDQRQHQSQCNKMVSELQVPENDTQYLLIISQELIKLQKRKIQTDCQETIHQQLEKKSRDAIIILNKISKYNHKIKDIQYSIKNI